MKQTLLFMTLIAAFSLFQCTLEQPLPGAYELLDRGQVGGLMPQLTIPATKSAMYWDDSSIGYHTTLLLGQKNYLTSYILLNCSKLNELDTTAIASVSLYLYPSYIYNEATSTTYNLTARKTSTTWSETVYSVDELQEDFNSPVIEEFNITVTDSERINLSFNNIDYFISWIEDLDADSSLITGMLLNFDSAENMVEFYSSDATSSYPYFEIGTFNKDGGIDTSYIKLSADLSVMTNADPLAKGEVAQNPEELRVGNGSGYTSLLQFDLSQIPQEAVIHQALLTMYVDKEKSFTKSGGVEITPYRVTEDSLWQSMETIVLDSSSTHYSDFAIATADTFLIESLNAMYVLTSIVSNQTHKYVDNFGFALVPENISQDAQEMFFYSGVTDPALTPTLRITYSLPADGRFVDDISE